VIGNKSLLSTEIEIVKSGFKFDSSLKNKFIISIVLQSIHQHLLVSFESLVIVEKNASKCKQNTAFLEIIVGNWHA
jgi:hypothetical protein